MQARVITVNPLGEFPTLESAFDEAIKQDGSVLIKIPFYKKNVTVDNDLMYPRRIIEYPEGFYMATGIADRLEMGARMGMSNVMIESNGLKVTFDNGVYDVEISTNMPSMAFANTKRIRNAYINVPSEMQGNWVQRYSHSVSVGGFYGSSIKRVIFASNEMTVIAQNAFRDSDLQEATFPTGCSFVGIQGSAFENCKLENVAFENETTEIENDAFKGCGKLMTAQINETSSSRLIQRRAFPEWTQVESIYVGGGSMCAVQLQPELRF